MNHRAVDLLLEILDRPQVYDRQFSFLSPGTLFKLGRTCRRARLALSDFMNRAYDINTFLRRFVDDPIGFRSLQARTNFLISGSAALQYLDRDYYPGSDLDIYTTEDDVRGLGKWLMEKSGRGYQFKPTRLQQPTFAESLASAAQNLEELLDIPDEELEELDEHYPRFNILAVYTFESALDARRQQEKVQLIVCQPTVSPIHCILAFHSSVVFNIITAYYAYSFYAKATFEERRNLVFAVHPVKERMRAAIEKYAARGWKPQSDIYATDLLGLKPLFHFRERWADDSDTWILSLNMTGVQIPPDPSPTTPRLTFDPMILNGWKVEWRSVSGNGETPATRQVYVDYKVMRPMILSQRYSAPTNFFPYVRCWFYHQGIFEMTRRGRENEAESYIHTWWDSELLKWKQAYLNGQLTEEQKACQCPPGVHLKPLTRIRR